MDVGTPSGLPCALPPSPATCRRALPTQSSIPPSCWPTWRSSPPTRLSNINRAKLENLIQRIFDPARLDIEMKDRFGNPVTPREWFLVPLFAIDEAVDRIKDGTITDYRYNPAAAALTRTGKA